MPSSKNICTPHCPWVLIGLVAVASVVAVLFGSALVLDREAPFAAVIAEFERQDQLAPPASGAVVFVGSSSFRLWHTVAADMAPIPVINRGFGGSQLTDIRRYATRIVSAYEPRIVVVYAGENDLAHWRTWTGLVFRRYQRVIGDLRAHDPELTVVLLAVKPSEFFARNRADQEQLNRRLRDWAASDPNLHFVDTATPLLNAAGQPDAEWFTDGLHLSAAGYRLWQERLFPVLQRLYAATP